MRWSPEELVQLACVDFVRVCCPGVRLIASMNGVYLRGKSRVTVAAYIAKLKKLGMVPGELDLQLRWPGKNILFIEIKAGKNTLSDNQDDMMVELTRMGFDAGVAYSLEEFVEHLKIHNVPMRAGILYAGIGRL